MIGGLLDRTFRAERGRVVASLARSFGDLGLAEDGFAEACARAVETWPREGLPKNPAAWLHQVARRSILDQLRRAKFHGGELPEDAAAPERERPEGEEIVPDERLRLLFVVCHPALAPATQAALALRTLGGLETPEIARAFLEPEPTTAQRIVRAKKKIAEAGIRFEVPGPDAFAERLAGVLGTVYLVFHQGFVHRRRALADEAERLAALLTELVPGEPEAWGLRALVGANAARWDARWDDDGVPVPLDRQDRARWDRAGIAAATTWLGTALGFRRPGPYQIQAAIAVLHAEAPRPEDTDWTQIVGLYAALLRHLPTPVVRMNAAVAEAMLRGPEAGLAWLDRLAEEPELRDHAPFHAARAALLARAGRVAEAEAAYARAIALAEGPERVAIARARARELGGA